MSGNAPVLVSGGAGYVGSHVAAALVAAGCRVVVLDDLSGGGAGAVPAGVRFVEGDAGDARKVAALVATHRIGAAMHLAAGAPGVDGPPEAASRDAAMSRAFVEACAEAGVRRLVLASSAAVYGQRGSGPASAYGAAKRTAEDAVWEAFAGPGRSHAVLRCFNVAGAGPARRAGAGRGLVRVACEAALGLRDGVPVLGADWDTADGTGVRDYVHVGDVAAAHVAALRALEDGAGSLTADIGTGRGHSVREVLAAVERAAGTALAVRAGPRRPGDVAVSVAAPERIACLPGWRAREGSLDAAVRSTLAWLRAEAEGGCAGTAGAGGPAVTVTDPAASGARR